MGKKGYDRVQLFAGVTTIALLGSLTPAYAQDASSPNAARARSADLANSDLATLSANDPGGQITEIVVTAQHRSERLQDVPISVEVIGAQARVAQNLNSLTSLVQIAPSIHVADAGRSNDLFIRGIGSGQNQGFDQSVGVFIDDIYHGRSRVTSATFLDIDRVEILKGPQSTFFGNNAIAGAFNIVTRKPTDTFTVSARALYSPDGNQYVAEGAVGGRLTDTLSVLSAATINGQRGWQHNLNTGGHAPDERNYAGRVSLRYRPTEDLDIVWKLEGSRNLNKAGLALQINNCPARPPFPAPGLYCQTAINRGVPTGSGITEYGGSPGQQTKDDTYESVLTANYHLGSTTLTSVTGYYGYRYNLNLDSDGTPATLLTAQIPERFHQFSQEVRVASAAGNPIEYMFGAYFQTNKLKTSTDFNFSFLNAAVAARPALAALLPYLPIGQEADYTQREHTYSGFGSISWNATPQFTLTGSLRATWVDKSYGLNLFYGTSANDYGNIVALPGAISALPAQLGIGVPGSQAGRRSDHAVMPSAKVQYKLGERAMIYASYARGFKAGGFNPADTSGIASNIPFAPEHVNAYEIGLKSEWFNRRLLFNLAIFRSDYNDLQVAINGLSAAGSIVGLVRNAAASRSQGIEFESQIVVTEGLRLHGQLSYLHARYLSYPNAGPTVLQSLNGAKSQDLSGAPTQYAPAWSGSVSASYSMPLGDSLKLGTQLDAHMSSAYHIHPTIDPFMEQNGYTRIDGRISVETVDGRWALDLIGKNLNNAKILTFTTNLPTSAGSYLQQFQQNRSIAFQLRYRF